MGRRPASALGMSYTDYAKHRRVRDLRGGSITSVRKAVADGRIEGAIHEDGTIDAKEADRLWLQNTGRQGQKAGRRPGKPRSAHPKRPPPPPLVKRPPPGLPPIRVPEELVACPPGDDGFEPWPPEEPEEADRPSIAHWTDLDEAKRIQEVEKARLARAKADALEGSLVPVADVSHRWAELAVVLRTRLFAIPVRMPSLSHEQRTELTAELTDALTAVADRYNPTETIAPEED